MRRLPSLRRHKPTSQAVVTLSGRDHYLGVWPASRTERIPAHAPELNPDELVWAWTKYGRLGNLAADDTASLRDYIETELAYVRRHPELLASFIEKTELTLGA